MVKVSKRIIPGTNGAGARVCVLVVVLGGVDGMHAQDWPYYGGDPGETHYSPLDQINRAQCRAT